MFRNYFLKELIGDIRKALNIIEFRVNGKKISCKKLSSTETKKSNKLKKSTNTMSYSLVEHYDIYQYIGKIMYSKRLIDQECTKWTNIEKILLPKACQKFFRPFPPKENLSELAAANMLNGTLVSFI